MELVRAAALGGFFEIARELALDPARLLRETGLTRAMLADPEAMVPARAAVNLLDRAAQASGCLTFGLRMAERRGLADMGRISLLLAHQPTLREALAALTAFRNRVNSTLVLHLSERDGTAVLREEFALSPPRPSRQSSDLAQGMLTGICRAVAGADWSPELVCFAYAAPPAPELAVYRRVFRCPLEFGAENTALVTPSVELDRLRAGDAALALHAQRLIETAMDPAERSLAEEVEELVLALLPSGRASLQTCAAALGLNPRTLQRQLAAEGIGFAEVLDRVRRGQLERHLGNPRLRLTDIAGLLGYAAQGAFTRWHVTSYGETPREARRRYSSVRISTVSPTSANSRNGAQAAIRGG